MTTSSHNINDAVRFKLTPHGREILASKGTPHYATNWSKQEGAWIEEQLWVFMVVFGNHFYTGCRPVIEGNDLFFGEV